MGWLGLAFGPAVVLCLWKSAQGHKCEDVCVCVCVVSQIQIKNLKKRNESST